MTDRERLLTDIGIEYTAGLESLKPTDRVTLTGQMMINVIYALEQRAQLLAAAKLVVRRRREDGGLAEAVRLLAEVIE